MAMTDLSSLSADETVAAYASRTLSPVEVARDALARIDRFNPLLNAFSLIDREGVMSAARQSENRWRSREPLSALDGIIATVKGNIAASGWPMQRGSPAISDTPMKYDAPGVAHLRRAGCLLIGQTTLPEFGWIGVTHSRLTGITRNPWRTDRTPGGSSGGAAVAAALRIGHVHLGTDGAGSIRIPAAFTGVFGLMPGVGRVAAYPASPFGVLARLGPLASRVSDAARMLTVLSAPDSRDIQHAGLPPPDFSEVLNRGIRGLRIGFSATLGYVSVVHPDIRRLCEHAALRLSEFGAHVVFSDPGFSEQQAFSPLSVLWNAGCASVVRLVHEEARPHLDPGLLACAAAGERLHALDMIQALADRAALYDVMRRYHENFDVLVTPTMPLTAFEAGRERPADEHYGDQWFQWSPYTWPFNVTGQPGASVPIGLDSAGLPVGLQIIGRPREEETVLRVARAVELLNPMPELEPVLAA